MEVKAPIRITGILLFLFITDACSDTSGGGTDAGPEDETSSNGESDADMDADGDTDTDADADTDSTPSTG